MTSIPPLLLLLALGMNAVAPSAQSPALRIVVIEGEAAVNIIQQNTAVRPLVEVRDRNNLPVPGVLVTFSIAGGKAASFGGVSSLTVATNAAGQAAVTGLTPSTAGAFQIQVQAAFQGQVATATIAQTNVLTAAQAAAAGGAAGGGSAGSAGGGTTGGATGGASGGASGAADGAAGGGGLSATTLAVAAGAATGGALAAVGIAKGGQALLANVPHEEFTGPLSGTVQAAAAQGSASCAYTFSVSGTARLILDPNKDEAFFEYSLVSGPAAAACSLIRVDPEWGGRVALSGPTTNLSGRQTTSVSSSSASGQDTAFVTGSAAGAAATGVLTLESQRTEGAGAATLQRRVAVTLSFTLVRSS